MTGYGSYPDTQKMVSEIEPMPVDVKSRRDLVPLRDEWVAGIGMSHILYGRIQKDTTRSIINSYAVSGNAKVV